MGWLVVWAAATFGFKLYGGRWWAAIVRGGVLTLALAVAWTVVLMVAG